MNTSYNPTEIFTSIKNALQQKNTNAPRKEFLKTEPGNTYTVRILPNIEDPSKTFFHYYSHNWKSFANGQNIYAVSRVTWGERDPIAQQRFHLSRNGTDAEKEKVKAIRRTESWIVPVYVVNDPVTPDNNGKVKVLRMGKQLKKIIDDAMDGDGAEEFGSRIFDLSANGCNLKIKVDQQGEFPSYTSSRFQSPKEIEGLTKEKIKEVYDNYPKLDSFVTAKSYEELETIFNQHFTCNIPLDNKTASISVTPTNNKSSSGVELDPEIQDIINNIDS